MKNALKPLHRSSGLLVQTLAHELLIYDLEKDTAFCLNETSALVYQMADGTHSISEISGLMSEKLKTPVSEDFVWVALGGLKNEGLLENASQLTRQWKGKTRREAIKAAGLATAAALPLITNLTAPQAIQAVSATCSTAADCPPTGLACVVAVCTANICGTQNVPFGDCNAGAFCDGNGDIIFLTTSC